MNKNLYGKIILIVVESYDSYTWFIIADRQSTQQYFPCDAIFVEIKFKGKLIRIISYRLIVIGIIDEQGREISSEDGNGKVKAKQKNKGNAWSKL